MSELQTEAPVLDVKGLADGFLHEFGAVQGCRRRFIQRPSGQTLAIVVSQAAARA